MQYDILIIGFGKAGKTLAHTMGMQGKKVALVEKSKKMYGGTCINVGCIPSKSLVNSAEGIKKGIGTFKDAILEKNRLTKMLREKNYQKLEAMENVTIYNGIASFVSEKEVLVKQEKNTVTLTAEKIFINTGSEPVKLMLEHNIEDNNIVYTSETIMELENLPEHLVIIGAGYIGMEFASMFSNFGSKVTVLQDGKTFLPQEDRDIAEEIKTILEGQGIEFKLGALVQDITHDAIIYKQNEREEILKADAILLATGRKPNIKQLHLENAGIEVTQKGAIKVDSMLRTNVPGIWAMGDVTGNQQFTYTSLDDYRIILSQLNQDDKIYTLEERTHVPYSVFMDVPYARVGLNEIEAQSLGIPYKVAKIKTAAIPKAQVLKETKGFLKALVAEDSGEILGAMLLCPESYEMINIVKLAIDYHAKASVLKNQIFTHPTMSEALNDLFGMF